MIQTKYAKYNPHGPYLHLTNDKFILDMDGRTGLIKGLYFKNDLFGTNFAGNELNMKLNVWWKQRYVAEKAQRIPMYCWTGDVILKAKIKGDDDWRSMYTFLSDDIRSICFDDNSITVLHDGISENPGGLQHIALEQRFSLSGDSIEWTINLANTCKKAIQIGELGLPIVLNTNHSIGGEQDGVNHRGVETLKYVFEQRVAGHTFISGHSSYIDVERLCGKGSHLLIMPTGDTCLEAMQGDYYQFDFSPRDETQSKSMISKGPIFYIYSKTAAKEPWYNGHTDTILEPGQKMQFRFKMMEASDFRDVEEKLYLHGKVAAKVAPGMVLPKGVKGHLLLKCKDPITAIREDDGIEITPAKQLGDNYTYAVRLTSGGQRKVRVEYGDRKWTNLLFYGIEPLEKLIKARAQFGATHQQVMDEGAINRYGFVYWNNIESRQARRGEVNEAAISGGNEQCMETPLFLSQKNLIFPDPLEIEVLDNFIEKYQFGTLQNAETFEIYQSLFGPQEGTWRRWDYVWRYYNYPHAYNVYFNLYKIAKGPFGAKLTQPPEEYLRRAYRTARAGYADSTYETIFSAKNYLDYHCGNMSKTHAPMGGWNVYNILDELKKVGMDERHQALKADIEGTWPFFLEEEYPYATEYCFDSPSFPAVYYIAKAAGDDSVMEKTVDVIMASRHKSPLWFNYGADLKRIGNYTTTLGARPLLDTFERTGDQNLLRYGYAATLGVWSCVDSDGRGYFNREWKFNGDKTSRDNAYWNGYYSGSIGAGLYGNLYALKSYLVDDPDFGVIGYGCDVTETEDAYTMAPWDGLGLRALIHPLGVGIELKDGKMLKATISKNKETLAFDIRRPFEQADTLVAGITGLPRGEYSVQIDGAGKIAASTDILEIAGKYTSIDLKMEISRC